MLGVGPKAYESKVPIHIPEVLFGKNDFQPNSTVIKIKCGLFNAAAITNMGDLYVWGRNKRSCLGLGLPKDQYFPLKVKKIKTCLEILTVLFLIQVALGGFVTDVHYGVDHGIAICKPFI